MPTSRVSFGQCDQSASLGEAALRRPASREVWKAGKPVYLRRNQRLADWQGLRQPSPAQLPLPQACLPSVAARYGRLRGCQTLSSNIQETYVPL